MKEHGVGRLVVPARSASRQPALFGWLLGKILIAGS